MDHENLPHIATMASLLALKREEISYGELAHLEGVFGPRPEEEGGVFDLDTLVAELKTKLDVTDDDLRVVADFIATFAAPDKDAYQQAIAVASDLIEELDANPEYTRGCVELIADLFGTPGVFLDDRKDEVLADLIRHRAPFAVGITDSPGVVQRFRTVEEAEAFIAARQTPEAWYIGEPEPEDLSDTRYH